MLKLASDFPKKIYEYVNTNNKYHPNLKKLIQNIYKFFKYNIKYELCIIKFVSVLQYSIIAKNINDESKK